MSTDTHRPAASGAAAAAVGEDPLEIVEVRHPVHPALRGDVDDVMVRIGQAVRANGRHVGDLQQQVAAGERRMRELLLDLLEVVDAFDRMRDAAATTIAGLPRSVEITAKQFERKLGRQGVVRLELVGRQLDPELADADDEVVVDPSLPEETVVRVLTPAYEWNGELLRRGVVVVSTPSSGSAALGGGNGGSTGSEG